ALRRDGYSKTAAARISNAQASKKAELTKSVAGRNLPAASFLVVGDPEKVTTWALPVRNADGSPDTRRMGAAWAALHGGYRGNKYEGKGKSQAIAKLRKMYTEQGRTVPSVTQKAGSATNYNWAAGGGEKIGGGLSRADDGKFTSVGGGGAKPQSGASSAEMVAALSDVGMTKSDLTALENLQKGNADDVSPTAMKKLQKMGFVDEKGSVTTNGKAMSRAIKNRDAEAIRALKPAKPGKGGGGGKAPKPSKGEIEAQNIKAVQAKIEGRVPSSASSALVGFSKNGEISPGQAEQLKKLGLMREVDGGYLATPEGKLLLSALKGGDAAKANEAILRGRERVKKNAERQNKPKPTTRPAKKELHGRVWVVTDKEGKHRWLSISSNSYQDREGEIVSQKALEKAVERGDMGDLRWWHEGGAVIGSTDFQMIHGRMLIESGTFKSEKIGAAFAKLKDMGVSVGFLHPPDQPNRDGVYSDIKIFERSVLPSRKAANALTTFGVM
ncbi:MAG: hypothetical protein KDD89_03875, partial [Anaerolineales bacterium]|nr:hypothetical protein [Anaerolineales bacterium]